MAYTDFTLEDLNLEFGIKNQLENLFSDKNIEAITPSERLQSELADAAELPIKSEKARSELIITPILLELRRISNKFFTFYSGDTLNADKERKLVGECDFILSKSTNSFSINLPILVLVEAKKQDIELGIEQCAAQMLGAQIFNKKRENHTNIIYGCVTTADAWKFMKLENQLLSIDTITFYKNDLDKILGIFNFIIDFFKNELEKRE